MAIDFVRWNTEVVIKASVDGVYLPTLDVSNPQDGTTDPFSNTGCALATLTKTGLSATVSHNVTISQDNNESSGFLFQGFVSVLVSSSEVDTGVGADLPS